MFTNNQIFYIIIVFIEKFFTNWLVVIDDLMSNKSFFVRQYQAKNLQWQNSRTS